MTPRLRLLDPRFSYVSAAATDVAATWRRFGFDPRANAERRARSERPAIEAQPEPSFARLRIAR